MRHPFVGKLKKRQEKQTKPEKVIYQIDLFVLNIACLKKMLKRVLFDNLFVSEIFLLKLQ